VTELFEMKAVRALIRVFHTLLSLVLGALPDGGAPRPLLSWPLAV
jgi:hypothetical protein